MRGACITTIKDVLECDFYNSLRVICVYVSENLYAGLNEDLISTYSKVNYQFSYTNGVCLTFYFLQNCVNKKILINSYGTYKYL